MKLRWILYIVQLFIHILPVVVVLFVDELKTIEIEKICIYYLFYIFVVVSFTHIIRVIKDKRTDNYLNIFTELASGNLKMSTELKKNTRKNIDKCVNTVEKLKEIYCSNGYDINIVKEKYNSLISKDSGMVRLFITDETGQQIFNSSQEDVSNNKLLFNGDRDYFIKAKKTGNIQISNYIYSKRQNKLIIVLAVPYSRNGDFMGIMAAVVDLALVSTSDEKKENIICGTISILKKLIKNVANSITILNNSINEVAAFNHDIDQGNKQIIDEIENIANRDMESNKFIQDGRKKVEEIVDNVNNIINNVEGTDEKTEKLSEIVITGEDRLNDLIGKMQESKDRMIEVSKVVEQLNGKTDEINGIIAVIKQIAKQTNLLSLNASIEAARAGEHGQGFVVVAEQIRRLSEQSDSEVDSIEKVLISIQDSLVNIIRNMERTNYILDEQGLQSQETQVVFQEIKKASANNRKDMADISNQIKEINNNLNNINKIITGIALTSVENSAAIQEITSEIELQFEGSSRLGEIIVEIKNMAEKLQKNISVFKY